MPRKAPAIVIFYDMRLLELWQYILCMSFYHAYSRILSCREGHRQTCQVLTMQTFILLLSWHGLRVVLPIAPCQVISQKFSNRITRRSDSGTKEDGKDGREVDAKEGQKAGVWKEAVFTHR